MKSSLTHNNTVSLSTLFTYILMRTFTLLKRASLLCLLSGLLWLSNTQEAQATHTMGGELTYEYVGTSTDPLTPFRYKIKFSAYVDAVAPF